MNDRLMIAAMLMSGNMANSAYHDDAPEPLAATMMKLTDALLAAAGEQDDPALHDDCISVDVHNVVVGRVQDERNRALARAEAAEAKVARLERQLAPLTEDEAREATGMMIEELGAKVSGNDGHLLAVAYVNAADRIRSRRSSDG